MRILRISLRDFRGITWCELRPSLTGVTIIEGPNEVGKSSIAEAFDLLLRLPDDSRNRSITSAQPNGRDVGPEVEAEISTGPYHVTYRKRWIRRSETVLIIHSPEERQLTGRDAHDRMRAILDETLDQALFSALRVIQGEQIGQQYSISESRSLIEALDAAGTGAHGDTRTRSTVWEAIEDEWLNYFTRTGRDASNLVNARNELAEAKTERASAQDSLDNLEGVGESLRANTTELQFCVAAFEKARSDLDAIEVKQQLVDDLTREVSRCTSVHLRITERLESAKRAHEQRLAHINRVAKEESDLANQQGISARTAAELTELKGRREIRSKDKLAAEQRRVDAKDKLSKLETLQERYRDTATLLDCQDRLSDLDNARKDEAAAHAELVAIQVTPLDQSTIEAAFHRYRDAQRDLSRAAPKVTLRALDKISVAIDNEVHNLAANETITKLLNNDTAINVDNLVEVTFNAEFTNRQLRDRFDKASLVWKELVHTHGLDTNDPMGDLSRLLELRRRAESAIEIALLRRSDALRSTTEDALRDRVDQILLQLPAESPLANDPDVLLTGLNAPVAQARRVLEQMVLEEEDAGAVLAALDTEARELQSRIDRISGAIDQLERTLENDRGALENDRQHLNDEEVSKALESAIADLDRSKGDLDEATARLHESDPETTIAQLENAKNLVNRHERNRRDLSGRRIELETTLRERGSHDLQDTLERAQIRLTKADNTNERLKRQAHAAKLLYETVGRHRDDANRSYVAPYQERITQLARLIFDSTVTIAVDPQTFALTTRSLDGVTLPFDDLSTGTREQLSIIARLACAMLVNPIDNEEDSGVPVILDDALGYSDPQRLRQIAPAFNLAAKNSQIIVLTSTPSRYENIGDAIVIHLPLRTSISE
ncbi:MAG: AAA family ATPase [Ferrimicrobium sp.]